MCIAREREREKVCVCVKRYSEGVCVKRDRGRAIEKSVRRERENGRLFTVCREIMFMCRECVLCVEIYGERESVRVYVKTEERHKRTITG